MANLSGLFDAVNTQVGDIAAQVGTGPKRFEHALITKWIVKTGCTVYRISNTFDIVMGVFELALEVISESGDIVTGNSTATLSIIILMLPLFF